MDIAVNPYEAADELLTDTSQFSFSAEALREGLRMALEDASVKTAEKVLSHLQERSQLLKTREVSLEDFKVTIDNSELGVSVGFELPAETSLSQLAALVDQSCKERNGRYAFSNGHPVGLVKMLGSGREYEKAVIVKEPVKYEVIVLKDGCETPESGYKEAEEYPLAIAAGLYRLQVGGDLLRGSAIGRLHMDRENGVQYVVPYYGGEGKRTGRAISPVSSAE